MSRNRFNLEKKYFYINHAEEDDFEDNGKLKDTWHKVRPFITVAGQFVEKLEYWAVEFNR